MQEPFSVLFSLLNLLAHRSGLAKIRRDIPKSYTLRPFYKVFAYFGMITWSFSMLFHARDFSITEKLDYFAAALSVLYGLYLCAVRIFRLDKRTPVRQSLLRLWTLLCILLYIAHISFLLWSWNYTYNMAANVAVGVISNIAWSIFSYMRYRRLKRVRNDSMYSIILTFARFGQHGQV
jgi:post-GPI attachment to proteins factor 3